MRLQCRHNKDNCRRNEYWQSGPDVEVVVGDFRSLWADPQRGPGTEPFVGRAGVKPMKIKYFFIPDNQFRLQRYTLTFWIYEITGKPTTLTYAGKRCIPIILLDPPLQLLLLQMSRFKWRHHNRCGHFTKSTNINVTRLLSQWQYTTPVASHWTYAIRLLLDVLGYRKHVGGRRVNAATISSQHWCQWYATRIITGFCQYNLSVYIDELYNEHRHSDFSSWWAE